MKLKYFLNADLQSWGHFHPKHKDAKIFEKHLNPIMLVFIKYSSL